MIELEKARAQLEELKLFTAADLLESRLQKAAQENMTYVGFINDLLGEEIKQRHQCKHGNQESFGSLALPRGHVPGVKLLKRMRAWIRSFRKALRIGLSLP